jgi:hypothetical protein
LNCAETAKRLYAILTKAEQDKTFGSIELELRAGRVIIIRKTETERYEDPTREITHANKNRY